MAGVFKRPPAVTGLPAVPTPANANLPALQQAINNIRARLEKLDAAVNQAYVTANASSQAPAVEALQTQLAVLTKELENLTDKVNAAAGVPPASTLVIQVGDEAEDGYAGPPGPPGPPGQSSILVLTDDGNGGGDEYFTIHQEVFNSGGSTGDTFLWDEGGRVLLTEDGSALLI